MRFEGIDALDEGALRACLATHERPTVTLGLAALRNPKCGQPPFVDVRRSFHLWAWPWTRWPLYDEGVLKLDVDRIERWYEARGYYDAHVLKVDFAPRAAATSDEAHCGHPNCSVDITITVHEGKPVRIRRIDLKGLEHLPKKIKKRIRRVRSLKVHDVFDEALYDRERQRIARVLREAGYARAEVQGDVGVHRGLLYADVSMTVTPGPLCRIGDVRVASTTPVPEAPILAASKLSRGMLYREDAIEDAQRSIYALGSFSAVTVRGDLGGADPVIDIVIEVEPRRQSEILVGAGLMSGALTTGPAAEEWMSVPQWDVHLIASYENRNLFGGLRRFRVEDRPRLIFLDSFPGVPSNSPQIGNALDLHFSQPGIPEARTFLVADTRWDRGPDPFLLFFRDDFGVALGFERGFFKQRVQTRLAAHLDIMHVANRQPIVPPSELPSSYRLPFLEQRVSLDLRDDAVNTTKGGYFRIGVQEAFRLWDPSWNYVRLTPDARGYAPLGLGVVLAARFALGMTYIFSASNKLDPTSQELGPQVYRLRGGGAQSDRGFAPGQLGDGPNGGIRRWESSLEMRVPIANHLGVVGFVDMGDVHAAPSFRFDHLNTAVGGGLRYRTIIGPIRLDVGWRPDALQRVHGPAPTGPTTSVFGARFKGAIHLTIGESF